MTKCDVLLVSPNSKGIYQCLADEFTAVEPNIWAGLLANSTRVAGYDPQILDLQIGDWTSESFLDAVKTIDPRFVLFVVTGANPNASSSAMSGAIEWAEHLKENSPIKIGFVGPHVNSLPQETMARHDCIDLVFTNEGVYSLSFLLWTDLSDEGLSKTNGIYWRDENNDIRINPPSPIVPQDRLHIDLPGMAYDLMPSLDNYRTSPWHANYGDDRSPFSSIYSSLGCSFVCSYCMINIINRTENGESKYAGNFNKFRHWDPEFTIKQLDYLANQGVRNIKIADELFLNSPKKHAMPLCDLIIERGYDFRIWAYSRISTVKKHHLEKLRAAGVDTLAIGVESISQKVRTEVEKGKFSDIDIVSVIKMVEESGINVINNMIVGLPGSTKEDEEANIQFAMDLNCSAFNLYPSMALPGSQLYVEAKQAGKRLPQEYSEFGFLSYDCVPLSNGILSEQDMLRIRDQNWLRYHTNPKFLSSIQTKFGSTAVENIKKMTKIPLKRGLLENK